LSGGFTLIIVVYICLCITDPDLTCPPLEDPDNGSLACSRSGFIVGDVCVVGCDDGFGLIGSNTRTCLGDQTWSGTEATCVELPGDSY